MADAIKQMRALGSNPHAELVRSLRSNPHAELVKSLRSNPYAELVKSLRSNPYAELVKSLRSNPLSDAMNQLRRTRVSTLVPTNFESSPFAARALAGLAEVKGSLGDAIQFVSDAVGKAIDQVPSELPESDSEVRAEQIVEALEVVLPANGDGPREISEWAQGLAARLRDLAQRHPILLAIVLNIVASFVYDGLKWWAASFPSEAIQAEDYRDQKRALQGAAVALPANVRMVSKDQTHIWRDRRKKHSFKYRLRRGQVVVLLETRGKLSRIGFGDSLQQTSEVGWVKNKYLDRLERP